MSGNDYHTFETVSKVNHCTMGLIIETGSSLAEGTNSFVKNLCFCPDEGFPPLFQTSHR